VTAAGAAAAGIALTASANQVGAQGSGGNGSGPGGSNQSIDGIVVNGTGSAAAPATSAVVQYILRYDPNLSVPESAATPAPGMGAGGYAGGSYPAPDETALAPVAEALVNAGVPDDKVKIFPGAGVGSGPFGPGTAVVAASIEDSALLGDLNAIVGAGSSAATDAGLAIDQVGAVFNTDACNDLNDQALAAAISNARAQADTLAKALGVTLGDLDGATMQPSYSAYSGYIAGATGCDGIPTLENAGTVYFPIYTATSEPQFSLTANVTLSFELGDAAS
jgi:hypothetical protein